MPSTAVYLTTLLRGGGAGALATLQASLIANSVIVGWMGDDGVYNHATNEALATDGQPVRSHKDIISGVGYKPFNGGDEATCPIFRASVAIANNRAGVEYDGADFLELTTGFDPDGLDFGNDPCALVCVFAYSAGGATEAGFLRIGEVSGNPEWAVTPNSNGTVTSRQNDGTTSDNVGTGNVGASNGAVHIWSGVRVSSTSHVCRFDGVERNSNNADIGSITNQPVLSFGRRISVNYYTGYWFAAMLLNNPNNVPTVESLLADWYGVNLP